MVSHQVHRDTGRTARAARGPVVALSPRARGLAKLLVLIALLVAAALAVRASPAPGWLTPRGIASGLTAIPWRTYAAATAIGVVPGTLVYTFFADALVSGSREAGHRVFARVLIAGALLVLLSFIPTIARKWGVAAQPSQRPTVPPLSAS